MLHLSLKYLIPSRKLCAMGLRNWFRFFMRRLVQAPNHTHTLGSNRSASYRPKEKGTVTAFWICLFPMNQRLKGLFV